MCPARRFLLVVFTCGLAACSSTPSAPPELPSAGIALNFVQRLATLDTEGQRSELLRTQAAFEQKSTDLNRILLALTLSVPQTSWRDDAKIVSLLAPLVEHLPPTALSELARVILRAASERQSLREDLRRRDWQLREERKHVEDLQRKLESLVEIDHDLKRRTPRK